MIIAGYSLTRQTDRAILSAVEVSQQEKKKKATKDLRFKGAHALQYQVKDPH